MKEIQMYQFESASIRTQVTDTGSILFMASDVCDALNIGNSSQATARLDDDEKYLISNDTSSGPRQMLMVTESGLYSLILSSRKPEAKKFKKWVTSEVIPSIRKTGAYGVPEAGGLNQVNERLLSLLEKQIDMIARMYEDKKQAGESFDLTTTKAELRRQIILTEIRKGGLDLDDFAARTGLTRMRICRDIHILRKMVPLTTHEGNDRTYYTLA